MPDLGGEMAQSEGSTRAAYEAILQLITLGELSPGDWVREEALSARLGTSRTPVREALRLMTADGVVEHIRNRGVRVRSWTEEQVAENYALRAELESYGARRAAALSNPDALHRLKAAQARLEQVLVDRSPGFLDEVAAANVEFHSIVLEMANSPLLTGFVNTLTSLTLVRRAFRGYSNEDLERSIVGHRDIILGIEHGYSDLAQAAMSSHILAATLPATGILRGSE